MCAGMCMCVPVCVFDVCMCVHMCVCVSVYMLTLQKLAVQLLNPELSSWSMLAPLLLLFLVQ